MDAMSDNIPGAPLEVAKQSNVFVDAERKKHRAGEDMLVRYYKSRDPGVKVWYMRLVNEAPMEE